MQGESFEYEEKGFSKSYLLDHFELSLDGFGTILSGDFYSKKGRGRVSFSRIEQKPGFVNHDNDSRINV